MSARTSPRVSIVMTVYNGGAYLSEGIESLLQQSFDDFELVIVDDGSTDDSRSQIAAFRDPRVLPIWNESNIGQTPSLNRGLAAATGEFIARQDADDISEKTRLEEQVAFLDANPGVGLVGCWYREIDAAGNVLAERFLPRTDIELKWALYFFCPFVHSGVMWRRSIEREVGAYDEQFFSAQDYDYWTRIASRFEIANLPRTLVQYRQHPQTLTSTFKGASQEFWRIASQSIAHALSFPPMEHTQLIRRCRVLSSLLHGRDVAASWEEIVQATNDARELHRRFSLRFPNQTLDVARHRAMVGRTIKAGLRAYAGHAAMRGRIHDAIRLARESLISSSLSGAGAL